MNSENKNNKDFYRAMAGLSLSQLEDRARQVGCRLEIEFDITQGQSSDDDTFQEGGTFVATYTHIPKEELLDLGFEAEDLITHLNGISEEDFKDYDKMSADMELKEEIVSPLEEKQESPLVTIDLEFIVRKMDEEILEGSVEKTRVISAFDKAKIDPEVF